MSEWLPSRCGAGSRERNRWRLAIRRELAAASTDQYRPDLAASLNNLSEILSTLGRKSEAEAVHDEAANIRAEAD